MMKLKYFALCIALYMMHCNLFADDAFLPPQNSEAKIVGESISIGVTDADDADNENDDLLQERQLANEIIIKIKIGLEQPSKIKNSLIEALNLFPKDNKESEKYYARKNALAKLPKRNLLLRVLIPMSIISILCYSLFYSYKSILPSILQSLSWGSIFRTWSAPMLLIAEVVTAIARIAAVGKNPNGIIVDALRVANELLFIINKQQFTFDAVKQGAYYSESWFVYDVYHLIKTLYNDTISAENPDSGEIDIQYEQLGKTLSTYILPVIESASMLYLALHIGDNAAAIKARKRMQAIYSLSRLLPIYLEAKSDVIDMLLVAHVIVMLFDLGEGFGFLGLHGNGAGQDNPTQHRPEEVIQENILNEQPHATTPAHETMATGTELGADTTSTQRASGSSRSHHTTQSQTHQTSREEAGQERQVGAGNRFEHRIDEDLAQEIDQQVESLRARYPAVAEALDRDDHVDIDNPAEEEPFDDRSIRIILEERLRHAEALIEALEQPPYNLPRPAVQP